MQGPKNTEMYKTKVSHLKMLCSIYEFQHTDETVLSHEGWTHFTIRKERNNIQVLFGVSQILLLSYTDEENAIDVKHIIGSSRAMSPGVWKVHDCK